MILGIFCAGNLGKEVYDIAKNINESENRWETIEFVDNFCEKKDFYNIPVSRLSDWDSRRDDIEFVIATGEPMARADIYNQLKKNGNIITNLIHPTVIVSPTATLGKGIIVTSYSSISSNAVIDDNVLIQSNIRVGHDIVVGKHSVISANSAIGGGTIIGDEVFVGMNATIKGELAIKNKAIISMGAVVFKDVEEGTVVAGNPARATLGNAQHKVFS